MAETIERTYTIPLRREYLKAPRYRRTEKASRALRAFLVKHMKSETVKVGKHLNEFLWMHGMKNPPHHVKVNCAKVDGIVYAELFGKPLKITKEDAAVEQKEKTALEKAVEKVKKEVKAPQEEQKAAPTAKEEKKAEDKAAKE